MVCGGGFEQRHHSPASRRRQRYWNSFSEVHNCATLFLMGISTGNWSFMLNESRTRNIKVESWGPRGSDPKTTVGEGQQQLQRTDLSSWQRGRPTSTYPLLPYSNKHLVLCPRWGLTPKQTGRLAISRNVTLTLCCSLLGNCWSTVVVSCCCQKLVFEGWASSGTQKKGDVHN
jgi:hypothetical protein